MEIYIGIDVIISYHLRFDTHMSLRALSEAIAITMRSFDTNMSLRALSVSVSDPKESNHSRYEIIPMLQKVIS